jgi:hypothetical protein
MLTLVVLFTALGCTPAPADRAPSGPGAGAFVAGGVPMVGVSAEDPDDAAALALAADVVAAAARTAVAPTLRYRLTVSGALDGRISPLLSVQGVRDLQENRSALRIEPQLAGAGALATTQPVEAIVEGGVVYLRGDSDLGASAIVEELTGVGGWAGWPTGGSWLRVEAPGPTPADTAGLLGVVASARSAWWVNDGVVDGHPVRNLRVTLGTAADGGSSPAGLRVVDDAAVVGLGADGHVRSLEMVLAGPGGVASGHLVVRWELLGVGEPVQVTVPAAEHVIRAAPPGQ